MRKMKSKSGFTMVEIIAVLVILGIMAAVATPKFINMADEARLKAALGGIAEAKGTLNVAFSKAYLQNEGDSVDVNQVLATAGLTTGTNVFGDVVIDISTTTSNITLSSLTVKDKPAVTNELWTLPSQ